MIPFGGKINAHKQTYIYTSPPPSPNLKWYNKFALEHTISEPGLGCPKLQATLFMYALFSDQAACVLSEVIFLPPPPPPKKKTDILMF